MKTKTSAKAISLTQKSFPATAAVIMALAIMSLMLAPLARAQEDIIPDKTAEVAAADTQPPSDVENVNAVAGSAEVTLTWNVATDNVGVKGYKVYYGDKPVGAGEKYKLPAIDVGNKITYAVKDLANGTTYYFAVTAYDDSGNESINYSAEVSATPFQAAADSEAPVVVKAEATDKQTVKVIFSEAVTLPAILPEAAFSIKNDTTQAALDVRHAFKDIKDLTSKTIILDTATQEAGTNYVLTAGIQIKDISGNPIVSGTSDTTTFTGSDLKPASEGPVTQESQQTQALADTTGPELKSVTAADSTHVLLTFNEPVKFGASPVENFIITEENNPTVQLAVVKAEFGVDEKTVFLTTAAQKPLNYSVFVVDLTDKTGNLISVDNNVMVFFGGLAAGETQESAVTQETQETQQTQAVGPDKTAPEDATKLIASKLGAMVVHLAWVASMNSAGDLVNYVLYQGYDGIKYGPGLLLDPAAKDFDAGDLTPGTKYFFKLAARDAAGNESKGIVTSFTLPATGPELGLLLLGSLGLGKFLKRRKNHK
jgi:hypothetical protein